jgi:hypothetical protein
MDVPWRRSGKFKHILIVVKTAPRLVTNLYRLVLTEMQQGGKRLFATTVKR